MKTIVIEATPCPKCGKPMPAGALAGLCPACLLAQGMATEDAATPKGRHFEPLPLAEVAKLFPQLEILDLLGAGGMGAVYKARQPALGRIVALKILPATNAGGVNFEERFNREARALARLNHPNIVTVHEFGKAGALHFFIMEFVDGANLRQLEQAGRLAPREALQIIPQICDALQYAHDEGVVHRDIKPENVLVDRKGRVKIADFGLAKILGAEAGAQRLTMEGQVMGTPHYMAPEQIEKPLSVDHRADIYALGVVLYEMLTGDLPIGKFSPPSRKVEVDVRLDDVVLRALENDPARRYQQASEVKTQVETIAATPASSAIPSAGTGAENESIRWAGFPVVIAHDGVRKVNRKETFKAFAILFGVLTIAFGVVSLVAGRTLFGWLGISGATSLQVRLLAAGILTAVGVLWALRSKSPAQAQAQTPQGTVILQPERFSRKAIVGVCWIPFVSLILLMFMAVAVPAGQAHIWPSWWQIVLAVLTLPLGFTAPLGTTILGWLAVGDIRRSRGRISGLPLAVFDGLFFPLLALDGFLIWVCTAIMEILKRRAVFESFRASEISVLTTVGAVVICLIVDFIIVRRVWRAVRLGGDTPRVGGDWWWSRKPGAVAIGLTCVAVIGAAGFRREKPGIFKTRPQQVAKEDSETGSLIARLPNGGTMELIALSDAGAPFNDWWRPNGQLVAPLTVEVGGLEHLGTSGTIPKDFVFRFVNLPDGNLVTAIECNPASGWKVGSRVNMNGELLADAKPIRLAWPERVESATLRLAVGLDSWRTVATYYPANQTAKHENVGRSHYRGVVFHQSGEGREGATLTLVHDPDDGKTELRVQALETNGVEHPASMTSTTPSDRRVTATCSFPVPLKQVKEFRVEVRRLHWVEFPDVALRVKAGSQRVASAQSSVQIAQRDDASGAFVAKLPKRGTVELLAVGDSGAAPNEWWSPAGEPIPDTLYEFGRIGRVGMLGWTNKDFVLRYRDLPNGASGPYLEFEPSGGFNTGGEVWRDGKKLSNVRPVRALFPPTASQATMRVGFDLDEWQTVSIHDRDGKGKNVRALKSIPDPQAKVHEVGENAGQARVTMLMAKDHRDWKVRVVATDAQDVEHAASSTFTTPSEKTLLLTWDFRELPLARVKEFRVQIRPVHWVEFRNVAIKPNDRGLVGRSSRVFKPTAFGAVQEIQLGGTDGFDFDKRLSVVLPRSPLQQQSVQNLGRFGVDAVIGSNGLRLVEMAIADLAPSEWNSQRPAELEERLNRSMYGPPQLPSARAQNVPLPLTYAFRTRDNGLGMMQILSIAEGQTNVTLRYKMIERAHFE